MTASIRVSMIIQAYHPRVGGAERQLAAIAPLLQARGVEVQVLTRRYPDLKPFEVVNNVPVHRLPVPGPKPVASMSFTVSALPVLRRLRPHVIHAHELLSPATTAVAAKRLFGGQVVATVHGGGARGELARLKRKTLGARRIATFRSQVDAFVVISREIDAQLAEIGVPQERREFIPNGVDTDCFAPLPPEAKPALRVALRLPDAPIAVFAGRLIAGKRVDQLLGIWPIVRAVHPHAQLVVLGTGPEEEPLRRAAGDGVRFAGSVDDVTPYLQAADVFVLPSAAEGLSVALLEAMSVGLPVITTDVGGNPDVIRHADNGWLIPADEPDALREAVLALLADPDQRARLGRRGRESIVRDYALPAMAERLCALYGRLVTGREPGEGSRI